jgi:uncharacterized short protein YbdD (DUF466 family)
MRPIVLWRRIGEAGALILGVPPYRRYCEHMALHHPEQSPMTPAEFFRNRQEARYAGRGKGRCC